MSTKMGMKIASAMATLALAMTPFAGHAEFSTNGLQKFLHPEKNALDSVAKPNEIGLFNSTERKHGEHKLVRKNGQVLEVSSTMLKIAHFDADAEGVPTVKEYTFIVDVNTKVFRKFKALSNIGEVAVGDRVDVWADKLEGGTAKLVWDKSIWWASIRGLVADLNGDGMTFNLVLTKKNGEGLTKSYVAKVTVTTTTEFVKADGTAGAWTDVANGQNVSVKGSWNSVGKYLLARKVSILP